MTTHLLQGPFLLCRAFSNHNLIVTGDFRFMDQPKQRLFFVIWPTSQWLKFCHDCWWSKSSRLGTKHVRPLSLLSADFLIWSKILHSSMALWPYHYHKDDYQCLHMYLTIDQIFSLKTILMTRLSVDVTEVCSPELKKYCRRRSPAPKNWWGMALIIAKTFLILGLYNSSFLFPKSSILSRNSNINPCNEQSNILLNTRLAFLAQGKCLWLVNLLQNAKQ